MTGLWLDHERLQLRDDLPRPIPGTDEALVRVTRAGICSTDIALMEGYANFTGIPGHEFVGIVASGPAGWIGTRVVGEINIGCGRCDRCHEGRRNHCDRRQVIGIRDRAGAFAQYLSVPAANLHRVPDAIDDDRAVFVEPLAAALRIAEQVAIPPGGAVLVVGAGKLGQLVARVLQRSGARITVLSRSRDKLAPLNALGIETRTDPPRRQFPIAIDCSGGADGFEVARRALVPGGTLVLKSTYAGGLTCDAAQLVVDEIRVLGSRCGPFGASLEALVSGLDPRPLITARYALSDGLAAFEHSRRRDALKVLIEPSEP